MVKIWSPKKFQDLKLSYVFSVKGVKLSLYIYIYICMYVCMLRTYFM